MQFDKKYSIKLDLVLEKCSSDDQVKEVLIEMLSLMLHQKDLSAFNIEEVINEKIN